MRFTDGKLVFEGDLQEIGDNLIYGFFGCICVPCIVFLFCFGRFGNVFQ